MHLLSLRLIFILIRFHERFEDQVHLFVEGFQLLFNPFGAGARSAYVGRFARCARSVVALVRAFALFETVSTKNRLFAVRLERDLAGRSAGAAGCRMHVRSLVTPTSVAALPGSAASSAIRLAALVASLAALSIRGRRVIEFFHMCVI